MREKPQTKQCKHCKTDIPFNAKVCPNCRKKQGGIGCLGVIIIVVVLIIIIAVGSTGGKDNTPKKVNTGAVKQSETNNSANSEDKPETETEKSIFSTGETVELNGIQVSFVSVTESSGSEYIKPADGKVFLLCEFDIANNSDKDITVSSVMSFEAYCDSYSINQSFSGAVDDNAKQQLDGSVAAGKKMNGTISYEVPTDWKELEINFTPDFWSGKDIKFIAKH